MDNITFDYSNSFVRRHEMENMKAFLDVCHKMLHRGKGPGRDALGWMELPKSYDKEEFQRIKETAQWIRENSDILVVIGIGGSYMGSRACIEALNHEFYNHLPEARRRGPRIYYAGNNMSSNYLLDLMDLLDDSDVSINVISKSGTTTEPAIAFRLFREYMENRYGKKAKERIFISTDREKGGLKMLADREGYASFVIPNDIGGRYSVLTPVGLLPIATSGIDIDRLMEGAREGAIEYSIMDIDDNISYQYALVRNILYNQGKEIEVLANYEPCLHSFGEWWKQLYGESEGKDGKGIYPSYANFTTDLHSIGQLIQDGRRNLFETTISIDRPSRDIEVKEDEDDLDKLNYLAGKTVDFVNKKAFEGTLLAHVKGMVPNLVVTIPEMNEYYLGKLIYFFKKACAISGYILGVNPFDQPGVEAYKDNMFKLLGRPKYHNGMEE